MRSTTKGKKKVGELKIMTSDEGVKILEKVYDKTHSENVTSEEFSRIFQSIIEDIMQKPLDKLPEYMAKSSHYLQKEGYEQKANVYEIDLEPELKERWVEYGRKYFAIYALETKKKPEEYASILLSKMFTYALKESYEKAKKEGISIRSYFDRKMSSRPDRKEVVKKFLSRKIDDCVWEELRFPHDSPNNSERDIRNAFFKELRERDSGFEKYYKEYRKEHKKEYPKELLDCFKDYYNAYRKTKRVPYKLAEKKALGKKFADACIDEGKFEALSPISASHIL